MDLSWDERLAFCFAEACQIISILVPMIIRMLPEQVRWRSNSVRKTTPFVSSVTLRVLLVAQVMGNLYSERSSDVAEKSYCLVGPGRIVTSCNQP